MFSEVFFQTTLFQFGILPLLIFLARTADMTLATLRMLFLGRGMKYLAALLGFFEILIWLMALTNVMQNLTSPIHYIAYAGGFAAGTVVGGTIEELLAMGKMVIRIITSKEAAALIQELMHAGFGVTTVDAKGKSGPVKLIYTIIHRKEVDHVTALIQRFDPKAFFSLEDIREASKGIFRKV